MHVNKVKLLYFTDPYCSWCWATEPVHFALKAYYGEQIEFQTVMGGLVKELADFSPKREIADAAASVAPHWTDVSARTGQPVDDALWTDIGTLKSFSSWPANVAAKAGFLQGNDLGEAYLRRIRRAALTERKNISDIDIQLALAAEVPGLDLKRFERDLSSDEARSAFQADLQLCRSYGITGFPSVLILGVESAAPSLEGSVKRLNGYNGIRSYQRALSQLLPELKKNIPGEIEDVLERFGPLTTRELSEIYEVEDLKAMEDRLEAQASEGRLVRRTLKGGNLWLLGASL